MNIISTITDSDIGYKNTKNLEIKDIRYASRGIVFNGDKIAIFYKSKINQYKLPGGGIEENENIEEAFKREVLEETGCKIEIIDFLGITEEYQQLYALKQISYVFVGNVIENTNNFNFTKEEKYNKSELLWTDINEGLNLMTNCVNNLENISEENLYYTKFITHRDTKILEYYIKNG